MLSHSTSGTNQSQMTEEEAIASIRDSYLGLTAAGFIINGWVTPSSNMPDQYISYLRKYYSYACTRYYGGYDGTKPSYIIHTDDPYLLKRVSLESSTKAQAIAAIDSAVENGGFINMMGHASGLSTDGNFTLNNMADILAHIQELEHNGDIICLPPWQAIKYYFHPRWND